MPTFQLPQTGTLNDANLSDEIITTADGGLCFIGISLAALQNGDDFDIQLETYDGVAYHTYLSYNITMAGGVISFNTGAGAVAIDTQEVNFQIIYLDSTHKLRIAMTRNSGVPRDFAYWYNKWE